MDRTVGDTFYMMFTTRAFATGIPTVLSGTPVVSAYEDNSATQITAGITLGVSHDGVVGMNLLTIVATGANGYEAGKDYNMTITTGTVDSVSVVGEVVGTFSLSLSAAVNRLPAALVGGRMDSNVGAISADVTAADNLELQYDGTGLTGGTFPATQDGVGAIGTAGGAALNFAAEDDNVDGALNSITFVGVQTSGTFVSTEAEQGTYHVIDDTGNNIDIVYQFNLGGGKTGTELIWKGYLSNNGDSINIQVYDFVGADWETRAVLIGKNQSVNETLSIPILAKHTGLGANIGIVYVRFVVASATNPTLNTDELLLEAVSTGLVTGFANGAVWVNTVNGVAGTATGIGHADNPSSNIADALTIAAANNLEIFSISPGSSITLAADFTNKQMMGHEWTLALGGQDTGGSEFNDATVSGVCTGSGSEFRGCFMGATTVPAGTHLIDCDMEGTLTFGSAGSIFMKDCSHGNSSPSVIDFGAALNASTLHMHPFYGAFELQNMGAGTGSYVAHVAGDGALTINANCSATSTINIAGNWPITNNASGITINDVGRYDITRILSDSTAFPGASITEVRMATLTDWINGGRLDLILDAINVIATDWTDGGRLDLLLDLVATTADLLDKLGAVNEAAAAGDPSATESVMQYVKQIVNILVGSDGIVTWPAAADPANGTSMAEALRRVFDDTDELQSDDIPSLLPAALVGGRMDSDIGAKTGNVALSAQEKLDVNTEVDNSWTTQMADSMVADGTIPTREQAVLFINRFFQEFAISGTTLTVYKEDGTTVVATFTLDDTTNPTSLTRAT